VYVSDIAQFVPGDVRFVQCPNPFSTIPSEVTLDVSQTACNRGRYVHIALPGPGRILHLCEVQVFQKQPWQWRTYTGVFDASRGKPTEQSTTLVGYNGGESARAVDGITTNSYNTQPFSCTHTQGNSGNPNQDTWWRVDMLAVYDVQYIDVWVRTDCCLPRNTRWEIYVGNSRDYRYNARCPNVPADMTMTGSRRIACPLQGRYVTIRRPFLMGDENILTICGELRGMGWERGGGRAAAPVR